MRSEHIGVLPQLIPCLLYTSPGKGNPIRQYVQVGLFFLALRPTVFDDDVLVVHQSHALHEVSPSIEESATFTDADWAELGNDFMQRMGLANHQYLSLIHI